MVEHMVPSRCRCLPPEKADTPPSSGTVCGKVFLALESGLSLNLSEHRLPDSERYTLVGEVFPELCSLRKVLRMEGGGTAARRVAALATRVHWSQDRPIVTPGAGFPRCSSPVCPL